MKKCRKNDFLRSFCVSYKVDYNYKTTDVPTNHRRERLGLIGSRFF